MTILYLANIASVHTKKWVNYFIAKGYNIIVLTIDSDDGGENLNCETVHIKGSFKLTRILKAIFKARKIAKNMKIDISHAHYIGSYALIGAISRVPNLISTVWGSDILISSKSKIKRVLIKYSLKKSILITYDAAHMYDALMSLNVDSKKTTFIRFGIDTNIFRPLVIDKQERKNIGIESYKYVIISTRNFEKIYDIKTLLKAMAHVITILPDALLILVGTGSEEQNLKNMVTELSITNNVKFIGKVENKEMPRLLNLADVYVSTSLSDAGIASSTAEAMSCGIPVLSTDFGENGLWVQDNITGYLMPPSSSEILAEKIVYLINNPMKELGENGRRLIREKNNFQVEMEKMNVMYKQLINNEELS